MTAGATPKRRSSAKVQVVQEQHAGPWKCGSEYLPYHPSASHVPPDYRDGWNQCYAAAQHAQHAQQETDHAALECEHLGDPVRNTGIYAQQQRQQTGAGRPWWIKPGETIEQAAEGWAQWCESRSLTGLPDLLRALAKRSAWQPQFDVMSPKQEALALQFVMEIAGRKGEAGSLPDPVRLLEMTQALYEAEREECGP